MCIIRTIRDPTGVDCLWFANLYRHIAGKIMDHRQYSGSTNFKEESVLSRTLLHGNIDTATKMKEPYKCRDKDSV